MGANSSKRDPDHRILGAGAAARKPPLKSLLTPSNKMDIWKKYTRKHKLGTGMCGPVYVIKDKRTGQEFAGKSVRKNSLNSRLQTDMLREIAILKQLDHPNVIKLVETIEDGEYLYLVLELCTGGELFEFVTNAYYSEREAAEVFCSMVRAVNYCHRAGICHRDLKLENFLFESDSKESLHVKLIDFGLSAKYCVKGLPKKMTSLVGTSYYMAPEKLAGAGYTVSSDIWALGVILFMLLSGKPPFNGATDREIIRNASKSKLHFGPFWKSISPQAKRLVENMLIKNPDNRFSAEQVLNDRWITMHVDTSAKLDKDLSNKVAARLTAFSTFSLFKKLSLEVIATLLLPKQVAEMRSAFDRIDTEKTGIISLKEFKQAMEKSSALAGSDSIFQAVDVGKNGHITYTEFIAATLTQGDYVREDRIKEAFKRLDVDSSGTISLADLQKCTGDAYSEAQLRSILKEVDIEGNDVISVEEFRAAITQQLTALEDEGSKYSPKTLRALREGQKLGRKGTETHTSDSASVTYGPKR